MRTNRKVADVFAAGLLLLAALLAGIAVGTDTPAEERVAVAAPESH